MDQVVVIKWGGSLTAGTNTAAAGAGSSAPAAGAGSAGVAELAQGIRELTATGCRVVVVHGGGAEITRLSNRLGIEAEFIAGQRVTDAATLEVVMATLAGTVATRLVAGLLAAGVPAMGLSGVDGGLLQAEPDAASGLGLVGKIRRVDPGPLEALFAAGMVPVVAPLALGPAGPLNTNADLAAAALAGALGAARLFLLTDSGGVRVGGQLRQRLALAEVDGLVATREVYGGMIPKLEACRQALQAGTAKAQILPGGAAARLASILNGGATGDLAGTVVEQGEGGEADVA